MGKKSGPKAPDPAQTAKAQMEMNKEAILASALTNRTNMVGPSGSSYWTDAQGNRIDGSREYTPEQMAGWSQVTELGKPEQILKNVLDRKSRYAADAIRNQPFSYEGAPEVGSYSTDGFYGIPQVHRGDATAQQQYNASGGVPEGIDASGFRDLDKDYSADAAHVEKATYDRLMGLINPGLEKARQREENRLAVMGHAPGGEGYGWEKDRLDRRQNEAMLNAGLEAVGAGRSEQSRLFGIDNTIHGSQLQDAMSEYGTGMQSHQQGQAEQMAQVASANQRNATDYAQMQGDHTAGMQDRSLQERELLNMLANQEQARSRWGNEMLTKRTQGINELSALLGQGQAIGMPTTPGAAQYQVASPDMIGLVNNAYNTKANNQMSKKGGMTDLAGTLGGAAIQAGMFSDSRLKSNIRKVGKHGKHDWFTWEWNDLAKPLGLSGKAMGVIAQEVQKYAPWLVGERDGYLAVNYGGL